jgi:hypothetical protein
LTIAQVVDPILAQPVERPIHQLVQRRRFWRSSAARLYSPTSGRPLGQRPRFSRAS